MKFTLAVALLCVGACLASPRRFDEKIVGGEIATPHAFPYQVALKIPTADGNAFCGGALLSDEWVLTAAHCAEISDNFIITLGAHNISDAAESTQIVIESTEKIIHPDWDMAVLQNDLALLRLPQKVEFNANIQPLRLPARSLIGQTLEKQNATVSGWGKYQDDINAISPVLRYVTKNIITRLACNSRYLGVIQPTHLCIAGTNGQSSCQGDSGGPLTLTEEDGQVTSVGIVSFGFGLGCELGWPAVFTRVTSYAEWISEQTGIPLRD